MRHRLLVPTRGRPASAVRLGTAVRDTTVPGLTALTFVLDHDDPAQVLYLETILGQVPEAQILVTPPDIEPGMGPALNWAAARTLREDPGTAWLGFMGDDHLPSTPGWDEQMCAALGTSPGVAYGDDRHQRQNLPTACVITAALVAFLEYMVPPGMIHLYLDDFWRQLGEATRLVYLPGVTIEHLHPDAGKALPDATYARAGCNPALYAADRARWTAFQAGPWKADRARITAWMAESGVMT